MVSPQQAAVDAALLVLKSMGLSPADLAGAPSSRPPVPTFAEYVPVVAATVTKGTLPSSHMSSGFALAAHSSPLYQDHRLDGSEWCMISMLDGIQSF